MTKLIIDTQNAINLYNKKYPKQKPLTKSELSKITVFVIILSFICILKFSYQ